MTFSLRRLLAATAFVAILLASFLAVQRSIVGRSQISRRIQLRIDAMSAITPANLTPQQWKIMVDWTHNLHSNSLLPFQTSASEIRAFELRMNERLDGPVDATTIEWIWDEYAKVCRGGFEYQRFRLHVNESLETLGSPVLLDHPPSG